MRHYAIQRWFSEVANARGDAGAVVSGDRTLTYSQLAMCSDRIAEALSQASPGKGVTTCIACVHACDYIVALLGVLKAGGIAFPIDLALPKHRLQQMTLIARPSLAIVDEHGLASLGNFIPDWLGTVPIRLDVTTPCDHAIGSGGQSASGTPPIDPDDPCYVFFTSGSTGEPKGILGRTQGVAHFVDWEICTFHVGESDSVAMFTSPGFDTVLRDIFTPLCAGGQVCVPEERNVINDPSALFRWLRGAGITLWHTVPSVLRSLLALPLSKNDLPCLSRVLVAGEPLLLSDVKRWFDVFPRDVELVNLYGPSETTMVKLFHRVTHGDCERARIPIGRPIDGCRAIVLDDAGVPAGLGIIGEIYLRTPYRSLGYLNRPELTADVFVPNPMNNDPNDLLYRTGDLGRISEDGTLEYFGRRDRQVKIRGVRVELSEVEDVLRRHEAILDVAVVDREDGVGNLQLCAYVVLTPQASVDAIRIHVGFHLPEAMVPTIYLPVDRIPRTTTGKLDHAALLRDPNVGQARVSAFRPPRTPFEQAVAEIWAEVLVIDKIGVTDSFFTVGGHSLLAMQILSRIEANFAVQLPLQEFLLTPTIECVAQILEKALLAKAETDQELQNLIDASGFEDIPSQPAR
jgi:amino acid adenylation domain-containing protein